MPLLKVGVVSLLDEVVLGLVVSLLEPPLDSPSLAPGLLPSRGDPPKAFPDPSLEFKLDFLDSTLDASLAIS